MDVSLNPAGDLTLHVAQQWRSVKPKLAKRLQRKRTHLAESLGLRRDNVAIAPTMARGTFWENSNSFKGSWSMSDEQQRLSRIEAKLDKLAETVVQLARVEERLVTVFNRVDLADVEIRALEAKVDELEEVSQGRSHFYSIIERLTWITATAFIGALFYMWKIGAPS